MPAPHRHPKLEAVARSGAQSEAAEPLNAAVQSSSDESESDVGSVQTAGRLAGTQPGASRLARRAAVGATAVAAVAVLSYAASTLSGRSFVMQGVPERAREEIVSEAKLFTYAKNETPAYCGYVKLGWSVYTDDHDSYQKSDTWEQCCSYCQSSPECHIWTWFAANSTTGTPNSCNLKKVGFPDRNGTSKSGCPRFLKAEGSVSGTPENFGAKGVSLKGCFPRKNTTTTTSTTMTSTETETTTFSGDGLGGGAAPVGGGFHPHWWMWPLIALAALLATLLFLAIVCWMREEEEPPAPIVKVIHEHHEHVPPPPPPNYYAKGFVDGMANYLQQTPPTATVEISGVDSVGDGIPDVLRTPGLAASNLQIQPGMPGAPVDISAVGTTVLQPPGAPGTTMMNSPPAPVSGPMGTMMMPSPAALTAGGPVGTTMLNPGSPGAAPGSYVASPASGYGPSLVASPAREFQTFR